jgi:hypothetical protein
MLKRWMAAGLLLGLPSAHAATDRKPCSLPEQRAALEGVDRLHTWGDLQQAYKRFGHCDDGAIAEGYSEMVVETLANRWHTLPQLSTLTTADPEFDGFVIRHIDETARWTSVQTAAQHAKSRCPKAAEALCSQIIRRADELRRLGTSER